MIETITGDIFDSEATALVNPVDTVGSVGGLARQFAIRYPDVHKSYLKFTRKGGWNGGTWIQIGACNIAVRLQVCRAKDGRFIINLPTIHNNASFRSTYEGIRDNLIDLADLSESRAFERVAVPMIGCGKGGLQSAKVMSLMERYLHQSDTVFEIYSF